jgi:hypothetical protein
MLLGDDWDILLLQEVWEWRDVMRFAEVAARKGYRWYAGTETHHVQHGILILIRADLVSGPETRTEVQFDSQRWIERWPGPNVRRGYLTWSFVHAPTGQRMRVASAHPQSFPAFWDIRTLQARQMALDLREGPEEVVILGTDLNAGPYYPVDTWGEVSGKPVGDWWRNAITYPLVRHYGELTDIAGSLAPAKDVVALQALPPWSPLFLREPLGGACGKLPQGVFTGTDCNSLYFASYAGQEYPTRLDHLFLRDRTGVVNVAEVGLAYTEKEAFPSGNHEPSDHYGVGARLWVGPKRP